MEKREETLKEALIKNEEEFRRWTTYQEDHKQAKENLDFFGKKLTVDVMVPIGSKAFMPGQLIHTNEVLISHYQGIFSKCSAFQAKNICDNRIKMAKQQLEQLEKEREMFQNKLDIPKTDGVLPEEGQHEIIEEYDEEHEKLWRIQHRKRVQEYKRVQQKVEAEEKSDDDVMKMLEELELMEELDQELESLDVNDDETLRKLISGEIQLPPEKKRISHNSVQSNVVVGEVVENERPEKETNIIDEIASKYKTVKLSDLDLPSDFTNNNSIPNSDDYEQANESECSSNGDVPNEVLELERETVYLSKRERLKVFKDKIKETEKSLDKLRVRNLDDLNQKMSLLEIREFLLDYAEIVKDNINEGSETSDADEKIIPSENGNIFHKRRISFAMEDQVKYIDNTKPVESMFKDDKEKIQKDIITLDPELDPKNFQQETEAQPSNKKKSIIEIVEQNCEYASNEQSDQDFDLVSKIINASENIERTLNISFNHSDKVFVPPANEGNELQNEGSDDNEEKIIGSPSDIYKSFGNYFPNVNIDDEPIRDPKASDSAFSEAYEDVRTKFFCPQNVIEEDKPEEINGYNNLQNNIPTKSILKNKDAVKQETHLKQEKGKNKKKKKVEDDYYDGFEKIMGEVVENPITEPEPLPEGKFIDAHTPKKRVSRFKQMRSSQT